MENNKFVFPSSLRNASFALIAVGVVAFAIGFFTNPERTWANFLLDNIYFLGLAIGATFYQAIQYITQSGWSAQYKRIPEAMGQFLPVAAIGFILILIFGSHSLYHWTHPEAVAHDHLLEHKSPYLNLPFFGIRLVAYFGLWILMTTLLRKWSLKEDLEGGMDYFRKSEFYSRVTIFILAFSFSLFAVDWMMSIDAHWFSTIYAAKNFMSAFLHGVAFITLVVIFMRRKGYFPATNTVHLHDFSRYLFALTIVYGYTWFSQFFLIWFANIPEETFYYVERAKNWHPLMLVSFGINFFFPFLFLLWNRIAKSENGLIIASVIMLLGYWVDLYEQIMPGVAMQHPDGVIAGFGIVEIGGFIGYFGLFIFIFATVLSKNNLIPVNHPYLEESLQHDGQ